MPSSKRKYDRIWNSRNNVNNYQKIKGKNIERFLKRLINNNIELLSINYINYKEIIIEVKKEDYEKILDIKTVYEVNLLGIKGIDLIKQWICNDTNKVELMGRYRAKKRTTRYS